MNNIFRNRERAGLCFLMVIAVFLTGCPKKVSPVGKPTKSPSIMDDGSRVGDARKSPTGAEGGDVTSTVQDEEIADAPSDLSSPVNPVSPSDNAPFAGVVNLSDIFFDYGQSNVRSTDIPLLEKNVKWLSENPIRKIELEGHADKRGTNEYNLVLAEKRANAVREYLVQLGVDSSKILVVSFGEERPFCTTENEACFQENRRAHFHVE